jgi:hypothetical protein
VAHSAAQAHARLVHARLCARAGLLHGAHRRRARLAGRGGARRRRRALVSAPDARCATLRAKQANPLSRLLLFRGGAGFRERLLGDALFLNKLSIEVGIGVVTKLSAEAAKRGASFTREADFVFANVCMAIIADWMLTWLPAPLLSLTARPSAAATAGARFWAGVPANAFQTVAAGALPFSRVQRLAAVARNGAKLFAVGTAASFFGTGAANASIAIRKRLDPGYTQKGEDMDIVRQSLTYGAYMAISSNLRYQLVAGVLEQRLIEPLLHGAPLVSTAASFVVRTGNTFLGSLLWVDFLRLCGLQRIKASPTPPIPPPTDKGRKGRKGR